MIPRKTKPKKEENNPTKLNFALMFCISLATMFSLPIAFATQPTTLYLTGRMDYAVTPISQREAGKNLIVKTSEDTTLTMWTQGNPNNPLVVGTSTDDACQIHIYSEDRTSFPQSTLMSFQWYTGLHIYDDFTIDGKTGTVVIKIVAQVEPGRTGTWVVINSGGELQGLTGHGELGIPNGVPPPGYFELEGWMRIPS